MRSRLLSRINVAFPFCLAKHRSFQTLPVIDIQPLLSHSTTTTSSSSRNSRDQIRVAEQLHNACKDVGFFYITNAMDPAIADAVRLQARRFFELPDSIKNQIRLSPETHYRGYQPIGTNVTQNKRDMHEGLDLYREAPPHPSNPIHGPNPPLAKYAPHFQAAIDQYVDACLHLGSTLLQGIAIGLGLPRSAFASFTRQPYWVLRAIHYPHLALVGKENSTTTNTNTNTNQVSCGAHSDYGLLTIVNQDPVISALQVLNKDGHWIDAPPIKDSFVINVGDMFSVLTKDLYQPTVHRVMNDRSPDQKSRISIPFFYEPNYEAVLRPLDGIGDGGGGKKRAPVRYRDHLESKVLHNFNFAYSSADSSSSCSSSSAAAV